MVRAQWKKSLVAALAWAGLAWAELAWGQAGPAPTPPLEIGRDLLTVREAGRPNQKCRILKAWKQSDGALAFEVQCLETDEHLTIVEMSSIEGGLSESSKGMKSRIYHWGQNTTPPPGVPQMPVAPMKAPEIESVEKSGAASRNTAPGATASPTMAATTNAPASAPSDKSEPIYPLPPETKLGPIQVETAKPSNWHESWGKADDHHTDLSPEKITTASPPSSEPQALPSLPPTTTVISETSVPPATSVEQGPAQVPADSSQSTEKVNAGPETVQSAGYSHIDDRPGIADVTDIPPANVKAASRSKAPVMDFLRTLWKAPLKDPTPLQTIQVAEMPAVTPAPSAQQFQTVLQDSLLPSEREMAAEALTGFQRQQDPAIVPVLLHAAAEDPAGTVRAACVHSLVKMNANTSEVVGALMNLKADPDLRVRREVNQALISFGLAKPEPENEMIHQISAPGGKTGE